VFKVDGTHDVAYINRNYQYKLVDRDLHPEPATLKELIAANEAKNPFERWVKLDKMPKLHKNESLDRFIIDGETYQAIRLDRSCLIQTPNGDVYERYTSISSPYFEALDILTGKICTEYIDGTPHEHVYKDVKHEGTRSYGTFFPTHYKKVTAEKSYEYNTRLTHL
jgi:hypothetical protein